MVGLLERLFHSPGTLRGSPLVAALIEPEPILETNTVVLFGNTQEMVDAAITKTREIRKPSPVVDCTAMDEGQLVEYREVADAVGLDPSDLAVEEFRLFLVKHDIPVFNVNEVASYMDELTARDNPSKLGWHWCPVRPRDAKAAMSFGRPSVQDQSGIFFRASGGGGGGSAHGIVSIGNMTGPMRAVDIARLQQQQQMQHQMLLNQAMGQAGSYSGPQHIRAGSDFYDSSRAQPYALTIPLHALKKIALIEKEFGAGKVSFLVTDYTTQPHVVITPDPFLMAVVPNSAVVHGKGRFIIDVWDEPGFGLARMLK